MQQITEASAAERHLDAARLHTLAMVEAELGKLVDARESLHSLMDLQPQLEPRPADWLILGRLAEQCELWQAADEYYRLVERHEREHEATAYALAQRRLKKIEPKLAP